MVLFSCRFPSMASRCFSHPRLFLATIAAPFVLPLALLCSPVLILAAPLVCFMVPSFFLFKLVLPPSKRLVHAVMFGRSRESDFEEAMRWKHVAISDEGFNGEAYSEEEKDEAEKEETEQHEDFEEGPAELDVVCIREEGDGVLQPSEISDQRRGHESSPHGETEGKQQEDQRSKILMEIKAMKKIVGYSGDASAPILEQIKGLYVFLGMEPLSWISTVDELERARGELDVLKVVVGIK